MAKTSKAAKASDPAAGKRPAASDGQRDGRAPRLDQKAARVLARQIRKLEKRLAQASQIERKRLRALERARNRRQLIEAALDELNRVPAPEASPEEPALAAAPAGPTEPGSLPAPKAPRPRAPRRPATAKPGPEA
jgi:translation initiation factor IF-2